MCLNTKRKISKLSLSSQMKVHEQCFRVVLSEFLLLRHIKPVTMSLKSVYVRCFRAV